MLSFQQRGGGSVLDQARKYENMGVSISDIITLAAQLPVSGRNWQREKQNEAKIKEKLFNGVFFCIETEEILDYSHYGKFTFLSEISSANTGFSLPLSLPLVLIWPQITQAAISPCLMHILLNVCRFKC